MFGKLDNPQYASNWLSEVTKFSIILYGRGKKYIVHKKVHINWKVNLSVACLQSGIHYEEGDTKVEYINN